ncbi:Sodium/hydrogen exchanger family protein [hydrothermal vent metagenome]|uniref:Sodium/hydrogen exchanger family protein n=1 Tax=hydrothermal vent metagenome TaxID=652676 RepID=A0A3B1DSN5_9ZZZZ
MLHEPIVSLAIIVVLGVGAQWLAWRVRIPSILLLLLAGMAVGPLTAFLFPDNKPILNPDNLLGDLLLPLVSISVGLILYEGGLTLNLREIREVRSVIRSLVTLGALVTWVLAGLAAHFLLGMEWQLAALLGAILVVTGPTVIGPLLSHIRPQGKVGPVLRWEGIVIDPIGALLAVLIYEALLVGGVQDAAGATAQALLMTILIGGGLGTAAALLLAWLLRHYLIPDSLQNPVSVLLVVLVFVLSGELQHESGLLAATVMGIVLANQRGADVHHILEFKENLRVLLISALFVVLGARISVADFAYFNWQSLLFVVFLIAIVRPASVWLATIGSGLPRRERIFLACVAPRGIVAAAVASVFAISLEEAGIEQAGMLVPYTFAVILGTVAFYGLAAGPIARKLGLATTNPQGFLFIGASGWARDIAAALHKRGFKVLLADTNYEHIRAARLAGLDAVYGNVLLEETIEMLELAGIGRVLALTPNDEVNALVSQRFLRLFDRAQVYRLPSAGEARADKGAPSDMPGRKLFASNTTYATIASRLGSGWVVKITTLSEEFNYDDFQTLYGPRAILLFTIAEDDTISVITDEKPADPQPGQSIVAIVNPDELLMMT